MVVGANYIGPQKVLQLLMIELNDWISINDYVPIAT
jgi:hypothetical protein